MSEYDFTSINNLLRTLVDDQTVPGCALSIRYKGTEVYNKAFGMSEIRPVPRKATVDTIWDLASITKV